MTHTLSAYFNKANVFFLRKSRLFVKSRYSRNRQWSKSIVYFGLWFNIVSVLWATYFTYGYSINISYLWWFCWAVISSGGFRVLTF